MKTKYFSKEEILKYYGEDIRYNIVEAEIDVDAKMCARICRNVNAQFLKTLYRDCKLTFSKSKSGNQYYISTIYEGEIYARNLAKDKYDFYVALINGTCVI